MPVFGAPTTNPTVEARRSRRATLAAVDRSDSEAKNQAALVARIRSGDDRDAETQLVQRYARGVRLILGRHTRSAAEADDLFQETFTLAVAKLRAGELRDPSRLPGFLSSMARNLATEHYRKIARRRTDTDSNTASTHSVAAGQLGELLRHEEARMVRKTLEELPNDRDREVLFRYYIADEDRDTIADDFGMTNPQFNRVLYRARQRYRHLYTGYRRPTTEVAQPRSQRKPS